MKVLFVSRSTGKGSVPPIIYSQGKSLIKKGIELDFFLVGNKGLSSYISAILQLRREIRKGKYNLVHVHYGVSGIAVVLAGLKVKKVLSLMGSDILGSKGDFDKHASIGTTLTKLIRWTLPYYNGLIVKSVGMKNELGDMEAEIIPNGVDFEYFKPGDQLSARKHLNIDQDEIVVLFPSNKHRNVKNYPLFEESINVLKKSHSNVRILWFNNIPHEETLYYFNAANVVVLTSYHEGSPNVIKEAMACNVPIVSVNVGDVEEVISETEGCFIAEHDNEDLANKIVLALNYDRTTGRDNIGELDSNRIATRIIDMYKTITES